MKILLIDDSRTMRSLQKRALSGLSGIVFAEAGDGLEALQRIATEGPFDLMLVDWNMPNMDGLTLIKKVREFDKNVLLVMVTTESETEKARQAADAGVNHYLTKPFTPESLLAGVTHVLASKAKAA